MKTIVLIGASTGGPGHIKKILSSLKTDSKASFVIVQHMNKNVVQSFANQLSQISNLPVTLAQNNQEIISSNVYICQQTLEFDIQNNIIFMKKSKKDSIYTPNIDILFNSACKLLPKNKIISILLTGIGDDGAVSMHNLHKNGAFTISESQESAIVYGMPKQALLKNKDTKVMSLEKIIEFLQNV